MVGSPVGAHELALERFTGWAATSHYDWVDALGEAIDSSADARAARWTQGTAAICTHSSFDAWAGVWRKAVLS